MINDTQTPKMKHENIVTVIQAILWIGAVSFLIWYSVEELQKVKETDYLPPAIVDAGSLLFPGIMICPSSEALHAANATLTPVVSVTVTGAAALNPYLPWEKATDGFQPFYLCPAVVNFISPEGADVPPITAQCVDFVQNPTYSPDLTSPFSLCDPTATTGQWGSSDPAIAKNLNPWMINVEDTVLEATIYTNDEPTKGLGQTPKPMVALLYSGKSMFAKPKAKNFDDYRKIFSLSAADRVMVATAANTNLYVKKYIRDRYPRDTSCDVDDFETQQDIWARLYPPCGCNNDSGGGDDKSTVFGSSLYVTYDSLAVTTTCHLTKHPLVFGDVLGIVGGGVAIVLACTLLLSRVVVWCASRGETSGGEDRYKNMV